MRAKVAATTQDMPDCLSAMGACSREEPQPKFLPPTIMSPGFTLFIKSLSISSMQCKASSLGSVVLRYLAGIITSVSTLSPYFITFPFAFILAPFCRQKKIRIFNKAILRRHNLLCLQSCGHRPQGEVELVQSAFSFIISGPAIRPAIADAAATAGPARYTSEPG